MVKENPTFINDLCLLIENLLKENETNWNSKNILLVTAFQKRSRDTHFIETSFVMQYFLFKEFQGKSTRQLKKLEIVILFLEKIL